MSKRLLVIPLLGAAAAVLVPAASASAVSDPGTCRAGFHLSSTNAADPTYDPSAAQHKDYNGNGWICVNTRWQTTDDSVKSSRR